MTTYQVKARRSGDWWALEVPALPGVFSQAKRLDRAEGEAREAIAVMLDMDPDDVSVELDPVLPYEVEHVLDEVEEARRAREQAAEAERQAMTQAAQKLTKTLSHRDAGRMLGVSFQRVSQLVRSVPVKDQRVSGIQRQGPTSTGEKRVKDDGGKGSRSRSAVARKK